ncbi:DJ-1/PfpI family protein [Clostridium neonatale]|uniref:DJ-1/PfpI family protein n=1 Tax=Clostridium neonatale TaxID=137838 RepID=UPI003D329036
MNVNIVLFNDFETLDIFGPLEILGKVQEYDIHYYSQNGGMITSRQKTQIITEDIDLADKKGILVIPGGQGTRELVNDESFLNMLKVIAEESGFCLSICTGSALLAKANVLNGKSATSNKQAFEWVKSINDTVNWVQKARWVVDGKYYTSSGVSAGIDMTLGFVSDRFGEEKANEIAYNIEYVWNSDSKNDLFSK